MGFAVNVLLENADAMRLGRAAALRKDLPAVGEVMREALRFYPSAPALERVCARETRINGRDVRRGAQVLALLNSAMMDDTRVTDPRSFIPGRSEAANLHFGNTLHRCIGEHISMTQIEAISSVLLARDIRRAGRRAGRLEYDGPYPSRLLVTFESARP
jgi:cytochrome P450